MIITQTMAGIISTNIYKVNGRLVVADNIEDAIKIYREYLSQFGTPYPVIKSVTLVEDDCIPPSSSALICDKRYK